MLRGMLRRVRVHQRLQFWLERQFVKGASFQLAVVAATIGLISLVGGLLVLPVEDQGARLGEMVWWAFLRLSDPGYLGDDQGAWRRIVSTLLTVAGYVVFLGALVAIMTQWLNARMRQLESGLTPVATRNHIVVLGWTNRTLPVVGEIMQSEGRVRRFLAVRHASKRLKLVVLSAEVTAWHAQTLRDDPAIGERARHIVLRSGTPLSMDDLERVDCINAAAVIIPSGNTGATLSADMATIKALLSLSNHPLGKRSPLPYVVAEIQDPRKLEVARRAYRGPLEIVSGNSVISRIMAQNLRHRGLSRVYNELLSHQVGCGIYVREFPELAGTGFGEVRRRFFPAVLFGVVHWRDGEFVPALNPPDDLVLAADDRLVLVAPDYESTALRRPQPAPAASGAVAGTKRLVAATLRRLLVLGWNRKVATLIHELDTYEQEQFEIVTVSLVSERVREAQLADEGGLSRVSCRHVEHDYAVEAELRGLQPESFDGVLLASSERLASGEEADTRAVVGYLLLEGLFERLAAPPQLILELQDPDNEPLIAGRSAEVIISPLILAHMIAQVALRRELRVVFDALFTVGGPELVFRDPADLDVGVGSWSFSELAERARGNGEILLGSYHGNNDRLVLCPQQGADITLNQGDVLVVVTTYY